MPRYHVYRVGGIYVGPAHSHWVALKVIESLRDTVGPGEPYATLYEENALGAHRLVRTYYRPREEEDD